MTLLEKYKKETAKWSEKDRADLADHLVRSLHGDTEDILYRDEWLEVARTRARELEDGTVQGIPRNEAMASIWRRLKA